MAFETATVSILDLIDIIASRMIGTGSKWTDADASFTLAGTPPGRVLHYVNGGEELYVAFVASVYGNINYAANRGILVFISTGWDLINHRPSGTVEMLQVVHDAAPVGGAMSVSDFGTRMWQYWMWYEEDMLVFGTQAATSGDNDAVWLFAMEHNVMKEYDDEGTSFFVYTTGQKSRYSFNSSSGYVAWGGQVYTWSLPSTWDVWKNNATYRIRKYMHPFINTYPNSSIMTESSSDRGDNFNEGQDFLGRSCALIPARARRSNGNAKVYMGFPVVYNDVGDVFVTPIATMKSFFPVEAGFGIADGDIINIPVVWDNQPAETWQYIYKSLISPDGTQIDVAIKYAEV